MDNILITGVAGFIGYHLASRLLDDGKFKIYGIDNLNDYYDLELKQDRLSILKDHKNAGKCFEFYKLDLSNQKELNNFLDQTKFDYIVHLAAQAGVRFSLLHPETYIESNIIGFFNIYEYFKNKIPKKIIFASSSSVYGHNKKVPFNENDKTDSPASIYAVTKKSNELMAYTYSHLYKLPSIGLRFFTVYGTYGRPDMAYYSFTESILKGNEIDVFNYGKMMRDFTHVSDIANAIKDILISKKKETYKLYNIGNNHPITLEKFISIIEKITNKKAKKNYLPMQPGDVVKTYADISQISSNYNIKPSISIEDGLREFIDWYVNYMEKR